MSEKKNIDEMTPEEQRQYVTDAVRSGLDRAAPDPESSHRTMAAAGRAFARRATGESDPDVTITQDPEDPGLYHFGFRPSAPLPFVVAEFEADAFYDAIRTGRDTEDFRGRYFGAHEDYPNPTQSRILPHGLLWCYVSSSFVSGFLPYIKLVSASLITRYAPHSRNRADAKRLRTSSGIHTDYGKLFADDVLLLARAETQCSGGRKSPGDYWFFWLDRDVSDCRIGRFVTEDDKADVIERFEIYAEERSQEMSQDYACPETDPEDDTLENKGGMPAIRLDPSKLRGWAQFF